MKLKKDRIVTFLMCYTFVAPYCVALTKGYYPEKIKWLLTAAFAVYAFIVHFCGFYVMELYSKKTGYKRPEYESDKNLSEYVEKKHLWPAIITGLLFAVIGFFIAYRLHIYCNSTITVKTEADAIGVLYEVIFAVWNIAVPVLEGIFWFWPDDLFLPNEPSVLYWIMPIIVCVIIPVVIFSANIVFPLVCLLFFYILHYFRRAKANHRASEEKAARRKAEDEARNRHNY